MDWSKVVNLVKTSAPLLGTVIGGPAGTVVGGLAGGAISLIAQAFGIEDVENPDKIYEAIRADPEAAIKLREIELSNKVELQRLALQLDQAYLQDTQNARQRQIEVEKTTGKKDINLYVLAWIVITGFFALTCTLTFVKLPNDSTGVIFLLFGALVAGFTQVINYFFGSSKSSGDKTRLLALKK